jgi:predicted SnoaL-like aldol condensation-catalyzing enzyme
MTKLEELEKHVEGLEAFLKLSDGYTVEKGQDLIVQREQKAKDEANKQRLEKEAVPPLINIHSVKRRFDGTGILALFEDLRQEKPTARSVSISQKAVDRLQQGDTSDLHMIQLSREPGIVFVTTSEVKDLPQKYEARIVTDRPIEVQLDEDAFKEF